MCGIAGIWGSDGDGHAARVDAMLRAIAHRGPDGRGALAYAGGAAGMVRLALVDLSPLGQQPLWSPTRDVAILFNGEVYDHRAHRTRLEARGHAFRSTTDTEVVLALYLEHGDAFVEHLRGMYAVAIFDFRGRAQHAAPRLVLARDPFGIKPLYLAPLAGGGVVFASELKGMLASGRVARSVSGAGLADYLAHGFVLQPHTMIDGVRMMMPGTLEVFEPGRPPVARTHATLPAPRRAHTELHAAAEELRGVLEDTVRAHAFADARVGAFLSGGVDSALVVALMKRHIEDLNTFTLRFPDVPGEDEAAFARDTARALGTHHFECDVTGAQVAAALPAFARDLDQPSVDGINTWWVSRTAAQHVKGVLSGLGGDEWFAGYPVVARMLALEEGGVRARALSVAGRIARRATRVWPRAPGRERAVRLAARAEPLAMWLQTHTVFAHDDVAAMLGGRAPEQGDSFADRVPALEGRVLDDGAIALACALDAQVYMGSQLLRDADATSMAASLELRVPFVDVRVAAFSRACADELKIAREPDGRVRHKRVLLEAARGVIPADIEHRKKRGFSLPMATWLEGPLAAAREEALSDDVVRARGLLDARAVADVRARDPRAGWHAPWALIVLEHWCRSVLDARAPEPASAPPPQEVRAS